MVYFFLGFSLFLGDTSLFFGYSEIRDEIKFNVHVCMYVSCLHILGTGQRDDGQHCLIFKWNLSDISAGSPWKITGHDSGVFWSYGIKRKRHDVSCTEHRSRRAVYSINNVTFAGATGGYYKIANASFAEVITACQYTERRLLWLKGSLFLRST